MKLTPLASLLLLSAGFATTVNAQSSPSLTLKDIMQFESITDQVLDPQGKVLAYSVAPDRGDSRGVVKSLANTKVYDVAGGSKPQLSADGRYTVFTLAPSLLESEKLAPKARKKLKKGLLLLDNTTGEQRRFERVKSYAFSEDGTLLAIWYEADEESKESAETNGIDAKEASAKVATQASAPDAPAAKTPKLDAGSSFELLSLASGKSQRFEHVTAWQLAYNGSVLALAQNDSASNSHSISVLDTRSFELKSVSSQADKQFGALTLSRDGRYLAYTRGDAALDANERPYALSLYDRESGKLSQILPSKGDSKGWLINRHAKLSFSADGERLFFGRVPEISKQLQIPKVEQSSDLYDTALVSAQRDLRLWHGDDPLIKPNEVKQYEKEQSRTYLAVLHLGSRNLVQLADRKVPDIELSEHKRVLLGSSDIPYRKMITWVGFYRDFYLVDINTGHKTRVLTQQPSGSAPTLSPAGKYLAFYQQGGIYLYDVASGRKHNLSSKLKVSFADEDHDYPSAAPGYGFGPWLEDDSGLLVYDKYDIWQFDTRSHDGFMLTGGEGRKQQQSLRIEALAQPDKAYPATVARNQAVLLQGYSHKTKADGFYRAVIGRAQLTPLLTNDNKLSVLARADKGDTLLFSQERYDSYPDLYSSALLEPAKAVKQTDFDAQRRKLPWGKSELVHWRDGDGREMDGVLIKPANYQSGKRYPVLVYFYRFMSDRLHAFPDMKINHRPNFAWYAADDYAIFLPDIRFEVGYPGISSVKALTAGVQKLIDMGIADPEAVGIQGHSWGGYQTAFAVTQTNIFKAAVSGAPVSNMTSAYSGIRHGTGLARQFQYETGQSRIGESLMRAPQKYIENSPVFYVDRIQTPMMIMFGDKDDAVPWEQGVELYLAMRRAGKDVVLLQYQDEPHHLKKYPNKLDYSVRMKDWFDHYLKGAKAPEWLEKGEAYREPKAED
ncbi:prolyl oligopeptidase family serine peptidase [Shewanella algae]|uniref:S9 family peptidase n=1 Tax=Shewanella algae TaxID=38313 RepID=UPI003D7DD9ED